MERTEALRALQSEIRRHSFDVFADEPPIVAATGHGEAISGCPACHKRLNSMSQFVDHIADDVLPGVVEKLFADNDSQS